MGTRNYRGKEKAGIDEIDVSLKSDPNLDFTDWLLELQLKSDPQSGFHRLVLAATAGAAWATIVDEGKRWHLAEGLAVPQGKLASLVHKCNRRHLGYPISKGGDRRWSHDNRWVGNGAGLLRQFHEFAYLIQFFGGTEFWGFWFAWAHPGVWGSFSSGTSSSSVAVRKLWMSLQPVHD